VGPYSLTCPVADLGMHSGAPRTAWSTQATFGIHAAPWAASPRRPRRAVRAVCVVVANVAPSWGVCPPPWPTVGLLDCLGPRSSSGVETGSACATCTSRWETRWTPPQGRGLASAQVAVRTPHLSLPQFSHACWVGRRRCYDFPLTVWRGCDVLRLRRGVRAPPIQPGVFHV
jgi:hypothetical protein